MPTRSGRAVWRWAIQSRNCPGCFWITSSTTQGKFEPSVLNARGMPGTRQSHLEAVKDNWLNGVLQKLLNQVETGNRDSSSGRLANAERCGPSWNNVPPTTFAAFDFGVEIVLAARRALAQNRLPTHAFRRSPGRPSSVRLCIGEKGSWTANRLVVAKEAERFRLDARLGCRLIDADADLVADGRRGGLRRRRHPPGQASITD